MGNFIQVRTPDLFCKTRRISPRNDYAHWCFEKDNNEKHQAGLEEFEQQPLISIVMPVYNANLVALYKAVRSVKRQSYTNWQLCIADDGSTKKSTQLFLRCLLSKKIKIIFLHENQNISAASNAAAKLAEGEYIALLDNDDELHQHALFEVVKQINRHGAELIYSDEDFIGLDGEFESPHFKPDFSPDLLLSHNYITHFAVFKKSLFDQVGGFRSDYDGAQDYDLMLRLSEVANQVVHCAEILYHWRKSATSTSMSVGAKPYTHEAGRAALVDALKRRQIDAQVLDANIPNYFRVKRKIIGQPLVSIIIPFKDRPDLLKQCLESVLEKTNYLNYQIIGISNNSQSDETFNTMQNYQDNNSRIRFYELNTPFNFSSLVNYGVKKARGEHVILMNNDIEIISRGWLDAMLEQSQRDEVGVVGAKLFFANNKIQHAGVGIGLGGAAGHLHSQQPRNSTGYFNRLNIIQNMSAVTGALMMVKRTIYEELKGFDEDLFKVAYNDVDFCLRALKKGYLNIFTPYAQAYHYESISRGYDESGEKLARLNKEKNNLWQVHGDLLAKGDPYYNLNFDQRCDDFSLPVTRYD